MSKSKQAETFPANDALFDGAFRGLIADLAVPDLTSSKITTNTYVRLGISAT